MKTITVKQLKQARVKQQQEAEHMQDMFDVLDESPKWYKHIEDNLQTMSAQAQFIIFALVAMAED